MPWYSLSQRHSFNYVCIDALLHRGNHWTTYANYIALCTCLFWLSRLRVLPEQQLIYSHVCILNDLHDLQNEIITNYFVLTSACLSFILDEKICTSKGNNPKKVAKGANSGAGADLHKRFQGDDGIFHAVFLTGIWWRMLLRTYDYTSYASFTCNWNDKRSHVQCRHRQCTNSMDDTCIVV